MDTAVALVQAYLQINGYFTVAEYPVVEVLARRPAQMVTDLDILAFRFPRAGVSVGGETGRHPHDRSPFDPDPVLKAPLDEPDMIVGEVKEGRAAFNHATLDPEVLACALARFGCCHADHVDKTVRNLLSEGRARTHMGHVVRLVAFGSTPGKPNHPRGQIIPMQHVAKFLKDYIHSNWETVRHMHLKDSTLGLIALLEKAECYD